MYKVKQLAQLAGVSPRTVHYYDEIDLLKPTKIGENGYRYYSDEALLRLQQILFYREVGLPLVQIKAVLDDPAFDPIAALQSHREQLAQRIARYHQLIETIDATILYLLGEVKMSKKDMFSGFDEEKQKAYEAEAIKRYGADEVRPSVQRWNSYSKEKQEAIKQESSEIYQRIAENMAKGAQSQAVQAEIARWHQHLRYFYEPSPARLRGLGQMYAESPDFQATFAEIHPDLPRFLQEAIEFYVERLTEQHE